MSDDLIASAWNDSLFNNDPFVWTELTIFALLYFSYFSSELNNLEINSVDIWPQSETNQ